MNREYYYYAFISYKREDEKMAKWLQNVIQSYRLPTVLRKEMSRLPKHARPVFLDTTNINAGILESEIKKELEKSRYLIVICSPNAVGSEWVNKEIEYFAELGRSDKVIPFIVGGSPNSKDTKLECYPKALKRLKNEPLGVNIKEIGKKEAYLKVVARLLDINFNSLWDRFKIEEKRKKIRRVVFGTFFLTLGLFASYFTWDYNRPSYKYYADYVDCWGQPKGIIELSPEERAVSKEYRGKPS